MFHSYAKTFTRGYQQLIHMVIFSKLISEQMGDSVKPSASALLAA